MDWANFMYYCEKSVATEIARPRVEKGVEHPWLRFGQLTVEAMPEAREKINAMTNMELLGLITEVMSKNA